MGTDAGGEDDEEEGEEGVQDVSDEDVDPPRPQAIPAPPSLPRNTNRVIKPSSIVTLLSCSGKVDKELVRKLVQALGGNDGSPKGIRAFQREGHR